MRCARTRSASCSTWHRPEAAGARMRPSRFACPGHRGGRGFRSMRTSVRTGIAAVVLLVGVLALFARSTEAPRQDRPPVLERPALPPAGSTARARFDACRQNVATIHDLYWASACTVFAGERRQHRLDCEAKAHASPPGRPVPGCAPVIEDDDDSPDCMLPENRAQRLNEARTAAEQECLDDAKAATRKSVAQHR